MNLISVGFDWPGNCVPYADYTSDRSLLDADLIFFVPDLSPVIRHDNMTSTLDDYQGKRRLGASASQMLLKATNHWKRELSAACKAGKTIVIFLSGYWDLYYDTGQVTFSGTGRNARKTLHVDLISSFDAIPFPIGNVIAASGSEVVTTSDGTILKPYWSRFGGEYELYLSGARVEPMLTTKAGERIVGGLIANPGSVLLLPLPAIDHEALGSFDKSDNWKWNKKSEAVGQELLGHFVELAKALSAKARVTPPPEWSWAPALRLEAERKAMQDLAAIDAEIQTMLRAKQTAVKDRDEAALLRRLLFETGKPLESAILRALRIIGFSADGHDDGLLEFDAVFEADGHRFLGEAEGKVAKAVNVEKLSQLLRNIQDDFARDEVTVPAKGVLFGNAYRLTELKDRGDFFTEKCRISAKGRACLVSTPDLFFAARYVSESKDLDFARRCREAIYTADGEIVVFPPVPCENPGAPASQAPIHGY